MQLRLVTLENYYSQIGDERADQLFIGMLKMRVQGYGPEYPASYLFMETADFIGTHHLVCLEEPSTGLLQPLGGFRDVTLECLDFYKLEAAQFELAKKASAKEHVTALSRLIDDHRSTGQQLVATSRLVIAKDYRSDQTTATFIMECIMALYCAEHHERAKSTCLGSGVLRFKSDKLLKKIGFENLTDNLSQELGPVQLSGTENDQTQIMVLRQMGLWPRSCAEKHRNLLHSRIIVNKSNKKKAA